MSIRAARIAILGIAGLMVAGLPCLGVAAGDQTTQQKVKAWDTDNDGTLDLEEAKAAAAAKFAALDPDGDGTLDAKEAAAAKIHKSSFAKADPDKDGTIDKAEYMEVVAKHFKAADADNDGTVSEKELNTKAGKALLALLK